MAPTPEQVRSWTEAGLYDAGAPDADERLVVLDLLADDGASVAEMVQAEAQGDLTWLPLRRRLDSPEGRLTLAALGAEVGWSEQEVVGFLRPAGIPTPPRGEPWFEEDDVALFRALAAVGEIFPDEVAGRLARVLGASMANLADAVVAAFLAHVYDVTADTGTNDLDRVRFNLAAIGALEQASGQLDALLAMHLRVAVTRWFEASESPDSGTLRLAVAFVDLVGYTPLTARASTEEIRCTVEDLENAAYEVAADHGGRVVKLVGDAVMFVNTDAAGACDLALAFLRRFERHEHRVTPRGGVAMGDVVGWQGDYYGPVVNLAARIADLAVPDEVLVAPPIPRDADGADHLAFAPAGRRQLKGFADPVELWAVTPAGAG